MKRSLLILVPLLITGLLFSCSKNNSGLSSVTPGTPYQSLDEALASVAPVALSTTVIVSQGAKLIAPGGTTFYIPPNAFQTLRGAKVTGSVNVTFNDWLKKGDMIFGKVLPLHYGETIESGGEAYLYVSQNGEAVRLKKDIHVNVNFPQFGATGPAFTGWVGRDFLGSANIVNWLEDTAKLHTAIVGDTVQLIADTLHYISIATPNIYSSSNSFTITMDAPVELQQSMAVAMFDGKKVLFPIPSAQNGIFYATKVPEGDIHVTVMGVNSGEFYGGILAIPNPGTDSTYKVVVKKMAPATLKLQLNAL